MTQSMVTVVAPLALEKVGDVRARLDSLGNPGLPPLSDLIAGKDSEAFVHFASLHAFEGSDGRSAYLILEFSADGEAEAAIDKLAGRVSAKPNAVPGAPAPEVGPQASLEEIYAQCEDWQDAGGLAAYWRKHRVNIGYRLFGNAGLAFSGSPGQSVVDIHQEGELAERIAEILSAQPPEHSPLARLKGVREALAAESRWDWALKPPPPPLFAPVGEPTLITQIFALAPSFVAVFLWPLLVVLVPLAVWLTWSAGEWRWEAGAILFFLLRTLLVVIMGVLVPLGIAAALLARKEAQDWESARSATLGNLGAMFARENAPGTVQNHMVSRTVLKPGLLRKATIRLAFWAVAKLTALNPRPGHLGDIGTIHFARWVLIPGTRDLLFFSNYGGSWESYLEDFITKANEGLTGIWSNTVGFPRSRLLFFGGAADGERFKRFARESMVATPFWYCAYPKLTTTNIRCNALVRRGVSAAMTEDEAVRWLSLYGSSRRPLEKLETTQIQSILFGGLGFKPSGRLLAINLGGSVADNRAWLHEVMPHVSFNDGRYIEAPAVLTLAFGRTGLTKCGLPDSGTKSFPAAFFDGMQGPGRDRILGDFGDNGSENWWWGREAIDIVLLVYGDDVASVGALTRVVEAIGGRHGGSIGHRIDLVDVAREPAERKEPFGFVDGVSQPAIRGTYQGLRNSDPIHLVEPGEFILGYPDNRGNVPPGPLLEAEFDPDLTLPVAGNDQGFGAATASSPRLIGHNGSFLVIRQLEQASEHFRKFCESEALRLKAWFPSPAICDEEFIAAKMIGRWRDGSSLVRNPYISATALRLLTGKDRSDETMREKSRPQDAASTAIPGGDLHSDPARAAVASRPIRADNDFLFGMEDPQGLRCPYGAHVRRANPRDSMKPGSNEQIEIANRHRIIRVGRGFNKDEDHQSGLLFMCLNGDLERQFEFIQQTWMGSTKFHGLDRESDPIVVNGTKGTNGFTVPTRNGPVALDGLPQFVRMRGGGYFFVPGRQLLRFLAKPKPAAAENSARPVP